MSTTHSAAMISRISSTTSSHLTILLFLLIPVLSSACYNSGDQLCCRIDGRWVCDRATTLRTTTAGAFDIQQSFFSKSISTSTLSPSLLQTLCVAQRESSTELSAGEIAGIITSCVFGMPVSVYVGLYFRHLLRRLFSHERRDMTWRNELANFVSIMLAPYLQFRPPAANRVEVTV